MSKITSFSIVLPTYTGMNTIEKCFDSILAQKYTSKLKFEVIVVIDGPSQKLKEITQNYARTFNQKKIEFTVKQFKANEGRFVARLEGAILAKYNQLLFVDDRV